MLIFLASDGFDPVAWFKTAAVVVVGATFFAIVIRALGSRPSAMRKGAAMPLDDLAPIEDQTSHKHTS